MLPKDYFYAKEHIKLAIVFLTMRVKQPNNNDTVELASTVGSTCLCSYIVLVSYRQEEEDFYFVGAHDPCCLHEKRSCKIAASS